MSRVVKYYQPQSIKYDETNSEKMKIGLENSSSLKNIPASIELSIKHLFYSTAKGETYREMDIRHEMVQENKKIKIKIFLVKNSRRIFCITIFCLNFKSNSILHYHIHKIDFEYIKNYIVIQRV